MDQIEVLQQQESSAGQLAHPNIVKNHSWGPKRGSMKVYDKLRFVIRKPRKGKDIATSSSVSYNDDGLGTPAEDKAAKDLPNGSALPEEYLNILRNVYDIVDLNELNLMEKTAV